MCAFGLKHTARDMAQRQGVPLLPGSGLLADVSHATAEAARCGYPVILKSTAGGGGIGLRVCYNPQELAEHFAAVSRLGTAHFGCVSMAGPSIAPRATAIFSSKSDRRCSI